MPTHKPHSPADVGIKVTAGSIYVGFSFYIDPSFDLEAIQDAFTDHNLWRHVLAWLHHMQC